MTSIPTYTQDPSARLGYTWDWTPWLTAENDTIETATVAVPPPLTAIDAPVVDGTLVTQRVTGGAAGDICRLVCQITTTGGLVDERSIYLTIKER